MVVTYQKAILRKHFRRAFQTWKSTEICNWPMCFCILAKIQILLCFSWLTCRMSKSCRERLAELLHVSPKDSIRF